ncbi:hypothetical protein GQ457_18G012210 [Hibiscus cannabinus]
MDTYTYFLLTVSKWVEVVATSKNDGRKVMKFLHKNIFIRFKVPEAIVSNEEPHFDNKLIVKALHRYGVNQRWP